MGRLVVRSSQLLVDIVALAAAFAVASLLRFDWVIPFEMLKRLGFALPYVILFQYSLLVGFGVHRFAWRYVGLREATRILVTMCVGGVVLLATRLIAEALLDENGYALYGIIPIGVILFDVVLAFLFVTGVRVLRRLLFERNTSRSHLQNNPPVEESKPQRTILVGAGQAGLLVAKEISGRPDLGVKPVAFVDDDPMKVGTVIHGIPVVGTCDNLKEVKAQLGAEQALITVANAPGSSIRRIRELCRDADLPTKIVPGVYEIVGGRVELSRIRDVAIEDLLGRDAVKLDQSSLADLLHGKRVLVTGAGGSIGSEICRQACKFAPSQLLMVEQAETSLFHIHRELVRQGHEMTELTPCIADICDVARMEELLKLHKPDVIVHAAAHKHVPMMEWNPGEALKNNTLGTRGIAKLADRHGVGTFVMISTDKAVNPTSVMGASKRGAEIYIQSLAAHSDTHFVTVRFGNVLGSAGSVIPIFKEQIARGGPVTVTHPDMIRYFMTIPEACQLVLQAGALSTGGEVFILDMGEPVKIVDLARDLIELSGFTPDEDIEITFTGMRPGEKLFEELSVEAEDVIATKHAKIFVGQYESREVGDVERHMVEFAELADEGDAAAIRAALTKLIPEFQPYIPGETKPVALPPAKEAKAAIPATALAEA